MFAEDATVLHLQMQLKMSFWSVNQCCKCFGLFHYDGRVAWDPSTDIDDIIPAWQCELSWVQCCDLGPDISVVLSVCSCCPASWVKTSGFQQFSGNIVCLFHKLIPNSSVSNELSFQKSSNIYLYRGHITSCPLFSQSLTNSLYFSVFLEENLFNVHLPYHCWLYHFYCLPFLPSNLLPLKGLAVWW